MPIPAMAVAGPLAAAPCDVGGTDGPVSMGTTIMAVTYKGGVILGADSRTSTGSYVANRASDKVRMGGVCLGCSLGVPCAPSVCASPDPRVVR